MSSFRDLCGERLRGIKYQHVGCILVSHLCADEIAKRVLTNYLKGKFRNSRAARNYSCHHIAGLMAQGVGADESRSAIGLSPSERLHLVPWSILSSASGGIASQPLPQGECAVGNQGKCGVALNYPVSRICFTLHKHRKAPSSSLTTRPDGTRQE